MPLKWFEVLELNLPSTQKSVLLALLKHADTEGKCYPGIDTLTQLTSLGSSTVGRALKALEAAGYITRTIRATNKGRSSTLYQLTQKPATVVSPKPTESVSTESAVADTQNQKPAVGVSKTKPKSEPIDYTAFQEFYNANRPSAWGPMRSMNKSRKAKVKAFVEEHGRENAFDLFRQSVRGVPQWWREKKFTFDTFFQDNRAIKWAELCDDSPKPAPFMSNDLTAVLGADYGHN